MKTTESYLLPAVAILALSGSAAVAQERHLPSQVDIEKRIETEKALSVHTLAAAPAPPRCFTASSPNDPKGVTFLKICISGNGNITHLESPIGSRHINNREGYAVCSGSALSLVHGFDSGVAEAGWAAPTVLQPNGAGKLPLIITRDSMFGSVRLTQTFTVNTAERQLQVSMDVKNISGRPFQELSVARYFDGDINGSASYDRYVATNSSVSGHQFSPRELPSATNALMLMPALPSSSQFWIENFSTWNPNSGSFQSARYCSGNGEISELSATGTGDYVGRVLTRIGDLAPGQTKTVIFRYRVF
jgi:hypothetical protein